MSYHIGSHQDNLAPSISQHCGRILKKLIDGTRETMSKPPLVPDEILVTSFGGEYPCYSNPEAHQAHLLEQYKIYVELADKISERRQSANSYFLTVNSALLAFVGYVTTKDTSDYLWLLGIAGMTLSYLWYRLVRSYRGLNTAKFLVIHAIEKRLPLSPYDAEWKMLGEGRNPKLYKPLTHIEAGVPWMFFGLHTFVLLHTVPWTVLFRLCSK